MQFTSSTLLFALAVLTGVQGQGGSFVAVGNQYSGGGCTDSSLTFADPIFGNGNVCQPLDRSGTNPPIVSYKVLSVSAGCSVTVFTDSACSVGGTAAPVNGCVQASLPFKSAFVTCPP